ncbi:MAG: peptidase C69 [Elusimicrobia bacterium CG_4_10_14_3_um_filter_49_12_50_7]|nr:MAG: peptidase C69 [Elusimicrobia bacterium CG03_land_8_20_14_0_80_50_18]PIY18032.1 MAG: peptidase C69 [Elusimicrobia bacterium CG_4_10_14_3_um_filter_49_12_50_7]
MTNEGKIVTEFFNGKCDFRDIFFQSSKTAGIFFTLSKVKHSETGAVKGAGFRQVSGDFSHLQNCEYTPDLADALLSRGIEIGLREPEADFDSDKMKLFLKELDGSLRERGRGLVENIDISFGVGDSAFGIFNGRNTVMNDRYRMKFFISVITARGSKKETFSSSVVAVEPQTVDFMDNCLKKSEFALDTAVALLDAGSAPGGPMPVLIKNEAGGTLIHEAIGHSLEADAVRHGISPVYAGAIGKKTASSAVTVIDDPTLPGKNGSYLFDDEGIAAKRSVLIEKGILKSYLTDRKEALFLKTESNGHGRRASFKDKPIPRMGITYLAGGEYDFGDLLKKAGKGILVKKMGGGQVNPANGDFVFEVTEGYLIEGGSIGPLIRRATLAGNGPELLRKIKYIGGEVGWDNGTCGKDGQGAPVSDGMPDTLLPEVVVGGE